MSLLQWLISGGNVIIVLILYSRTHMLPLLNKCAIAGLPQLLSLHSGSISLPLLSQYCTVYMIQLLSLHYRIHVMPLLSNSSVHMTKYWSPHKRAMPKITQSTAQLCSFHILSKVMLKTLWARLQSMWIKNFQIYTLDREKAEERGLILPTSIAS